MYKRASRAMQHAHQVNAPLPTGGMIGAGGLTEDDFIASAGNMSIAECKAELGRLAVEMAQANNQMAAAKRAGDAGEVRRLGLLVQSLGQRRNPFKQRIHVLSQSAARDALAIACREILSADTRDQVFQRARELEAANA